MTKPHVLIFCSATSTKPSDACRFFRFRTDRTCVICGYSVQKSSHTSWRLLKKRWLPPLSRLPLLRLTKRTPVRRKACLHVPLAAKQSDARTQAKCSAQLACKAKCRRRSSVLKIASSGNGRRTIKHIRVRIARDFRYIERRLTAVTLSATDFKAFVPKFFNYTGPLRPHYVTPMRWVPDDIPKPEYSLSGKCSPGLTPQSTRLIELVLHCRPSSIRTDSTRKQHHPDLRQRPDSWHSSGMQGNQVAACPSTPHLHNVFNRVAVCRSAVRF